MSEETDNRKPDAERRLAPVSLLAIASNLVKVLDAYEGKTALFSCQGQGMDGYSALAEFVAIAKQAREAMANDPSSSTGCK